MSPTSLRRAAYAVVASAAITGAALAVASPAEAATQAKQASARTASSTSFTLPYAGANALVPTWVFSNTNLCVFDGGSGQAVIKVQAVVGGAGPEYMYVPPFQQRCISRWWAGNPVRVTNQTNNVAYVNAS
jgi:hypothetical protein